MQNAAQLAHMEADTLRRLATQLISEIADVRRDNTVKQLKIDQLTHEMAILKRWKFSVSSEQLNPAQRQLYD